MRQRINVIIIVITKPQDKVSNHISCAALGTESYVSINVSIKTRTCALSDTVPLQTLPLQQKVLALAVCHLA